MLKSKLAHAKGRALLANEKRKSLSNSPSVLQGNSYAKSGFIERDNCSKKLIRTIYFKGKTLVSSQQCNV